MRFSYFWIKRNFPIVVELKLVHFPFITISSNDMKKLVTLFAVCWLVSLSMAQVNQEAAQQAQAIIGLSFDAAEIDSMQSNLRGQLEDYKQMREATLPNSVPPAFVFNPVPVDFTIGRSRHRTGSKGR